MLFVYPLVAMLGVRKRVPLVKVGKGLQTRRIVKGLKWVMHSISFCYLENPGGTDIYRKAQWATQNNSIAICNPVGIGIGVGWLKDMSATIANNLPHRA